ncbi:MAG: hypothetical protein ACXACY_20795 [Candidatus Hodarchaeales archaeon]|jgi:hypothetical protein
MQQFPVIYSKEARGCMEKCREMGLTPKTAILIHLGNKDKWKTFLSGKTVDITKIFGIDAGVLKSFGADVPGLPDNFTTKELLYILSRKYREQQTDIFEILSIVRGRHASQADLHVFRRQLEQIKL